MIKIPDYIIEKKNINNRSLATEDEWSKKIWNKW